MIEQYTREEIEQLKSCLDPDNFAAKLGLGPMKHLFDKPICHAPREAALGFAFWVSQFCMCKLICVVEDTHVECLATHALFLEWYDDLPPLLRSTISRRNRHHSPALEFENYSKLIAISNPMGLRGRSCSLTLISERITGQKLKDVEYAAFPHPNNTDSKIIYLS